MNLIVLKEITPAGILATNLTEAAALWNAATAYTAGTIVRQDDTHRRYKALLDSAAGKKPSENCTGIAALWSDIGVTNDWAPFDDAINTIATGTAENGTIDVTRDSSRCDTVAIFGLANASSVSLTLRDGAGVEVLSETISLAQFGINDWYRFFFGDFSYRRDLTYTVPIYASSSLRIVIHGVGATKPSVGAIRVGQHYELGRTIYDGSDFGFVDYSTDDEDKWGRADLVQGPTAKRAEINFRVDTDDFDRVVSLVESVRGRLAVWDCNNTRQQKAPFERAIILGRVRSFSPPVNGPVETVFSIEIRGVP